MAECRDFESLFTSYVDGESPAPDCDAVEAHLRACPTCRDRVAREREVREALVSCRGRLRAAASPDLRRRCEAGRPPAPVVVMPTPSKPALPRRAWVSWSMAATLVLALAGVFVYGLRGGGEAFAAQLALDHVKCFEFVREPAVLPDARTVGREWAATRGWNLKVPDSTPRESLKLLGIRRCLSTEGFTAHVMYKWRGEPLSVYVVNGEHPRIGPTPRLVERLGQEAVMWSKGGRTYAVVARGRQSDVEQVAQYVRTEAE